jgi:molybdopterin-binding protein
MKISGRNRLKGVAKEVVLGQVMAKVVVQVGKRGDVDGGVRVAPTSSHSKTTWEF